MTTRTETRSPRTTSSGRATIDLAFPVATASAALALAGISSALVGLGDGTRGPATGAGTAACFGAMAALVLRRPRRPAATDAPAVFTMATVSWLTLAAGSAVFHAVAGVAGTTDVAIFEGTATATTTAMTSLDPDELTRSVHFFRAVVQWCAGYGALLVALIAIPLASGSRELARSQGSNSLNPARARGLGRISRIYGIGTVAISVGFLVAGMGLFDAVAHGLTTISTGGLSTRSGSIAAFDSAAVEWVAAAGMAFAGLNLIAVWWAVRGDIRSIRNGAELRVYGAVMVVSTGVLWLWFGDDITSAEAVRTAAFTVTSAMSTTGFTTIEWRLFDNGALALLFLLLAIGAMSGSAGGGYSYLRVLESIRFAARELQRQLHPNSVTVVKVGGRVIGERTLDRLHGYNLMFIAMVALGGICVAAADTTVGPVAALSMSLSALVTAGPVVGEVGSPTPGELGAVSHIALSGVMLLGRLSIYPVLLAVLTASRSSVARARHVRVERRR